MAAEILAIAVSAVALVGAGLAAWWARKAVKAAAAPHSEAMREMMRAVGRGEVDKLPAMIRQVDMHLERLEQKVERTEGKLSAAIQKIGLVRYDADVELGGKVSFALALLDENDDGVILTSVYRLEDNRFFIREVRAGRAVRELSSEETRALSMATDDELQRIRRERRLGQDGGNGVGKRAELRMEGEADERAGFDLRGAD